jgi:acetyl esterase/lipase
LREFITAWKVTKGGPPAILFFGTEDDLLAGARVFARQMTAAGNRVELYTAAGQKHGFSNDGGGTPWHALVVRQTDLFLSSLGFLKGQPAIPLPVGAQAALTKEFP